MCTVVDMMIEAQRIEHAQFSLKQGTPHEAKVWNTQENYRYYNGKVILVKCFKKFTC